jgi:hypothetical protein
MLGVPATGEAEAGGSLDPKSSRTAWATSQDLASKRTGGVTQVVEHLASKNEALSSNPRTTKKKKEEEKERRRRGRERVLQSCISGAASHKIE